MATNKTGRYIWDSEKKTFVKVSDKIPGVSGKVWFPNKCAHSGHRFENLADKTFYSAKEKKDYMKKNHIAEAG